MKNSGFDGLFEVPVGAGQEPFEEPDLRRRANFQSRAPRAGADFKAMAIARLKEAGATIEKVNFRIEGFPVDAQVSGSNGRPFLVLARGTPDEQDRSALRRTDTVEKAGFMAMQLARRQPFRSFSSRRTFRNDQPGRATIWRRSLTISGTWCPIVPTSGDSNDCGLTSRRRSRTCRPTAPWRAPEKISSPTLLNEFSDVDARTHPSHNCSKIEGPGQESS